jgi:hypothetical protein
MNIFSAFISWTYLSILIISIFLVIQFSLLRPDVSLFFATDKHFRISDMVLYYFVNLCIRFYFFTKKCNLISKQRAHTNNMEKIDLCFWYSIVIENDFQCLLTVQIIWRRLWCAASTFNLLNILNTEISGHGGVDTLTFVFTTHGEKYFQISFHETSNICNQIRKRNEQWFDNECRI